MISNISISIRNNALTLSDIINESLH